MVLPALFLQPAADQPTLAAITRMNPADAGKLLLGERQHLPVVEVSPPNPIYVPGMVKLNLFEQPAPEGSGCLRHRWTASFHFQPGADPASGKLTDVYDGTEVALRASSECPKDGYVYLNPTVSLDDGFAVLRWFATVRAAESKTRLTCEDTTRSNFCANEQSVRRELAIYTPSTVSVDQGELIIWFRGMAGTEVRYTPGAPNTLRVRRYIPPPF